MTSDATVMAYDEMGEELDFSRCRLEFKLNIRPRDGEPSDYLLHYDGIIYPGEDLDQPVGTISVYVADLPRAYYNGEDPWEVLDCENSGVAHFCELISLRTRCFKPSVERFIGNQIEPLLIIFHLSIEPQFRGNDLGLKAIDIACENLGQSAVVALFAFPTQWQGCVDTNPKAFLEDQSKLISYYRRGAFVPVLKGGLMLRPWILKKQ